MPTKGAAAMAKWRAENPDKVRDAQTRNQLRRRTDPEQYEKLRLKRTAHGKRRRERNRAAVLELKQSLRCQHPLCGWREAFVPSDLDFHHVYPDKKLDVIAWMVQRRRLEIIAEEINKCVILCALCHRRVENGMLSCDGLVPLHVQVVGDRLLLVDSVETP